MGVINEGVLTEAGSIIGTLTVYSLIKLPIDCPLIIMCVGKVSPNCH